MPASLRLCLPLLALVLWGCPRAPAPAPPSLPPPAPAASAPAASADWALTSSAFAAGERLPIKYTADGEDVSPPLQWAAPPAGTEELVLICDDPDAPRGAFTHWVLYGLPPQVASVPEGIARVASLSEPACRQGLNSAGRVGYVGPAPPPGPPHRYRFTLYALSGKTGLAPGASVEHVRAALQGKILATTTLEGIYGR